MNPANKGNLITHRLETPSPKIPGGSTFKRDERHRVYPDCVLPGLRICRAGGRSFTDHPTQRKERGSKEFADHRVGLTPATVTIDGTPYHQDQFAGRIQQLIEQKKTESERVVVVKSQADVPYNHWIAMTEIIEKAGGIVTLLLEEEQTITVE